MLCYINHRVNHTSTFFKIINKMLFQNISKSIKLFTKNLAIIAYTGYCEILIKFYNKTES